MTAEEKKQLQILVDKYIEEDVYKPRTWGDKEARTLSAALACEWLQAHCFRPDPA